jgi:transposase-like protein
MPDYKQLVYNLIAAGNSKSQIREIFNNMNFIISEQAISEIYKELEIKINDFKNRPLPKNIAVLFIDGKHLKIKHENKVKEAVLYILLGYDFDGNKHILGFYVLFGKETINQWKKIFNDLLNRGLENVLLFVCDNLSGMTETLNLIFHNPDIQLCLVHIKRNIRRHLPTDNANVIINKLDELKASSLSSNEAADSFRKSLKPFMKEYKYFLVKLNKDSDFIFSFLDYPVQLQKIIATTNPVESLNNQVEKLATKYEGYFQSLNLLEINIFLLKNKWESKWSKSVSPFVAKFAHFFRKKLFLKSDVREVIELCD